MMVGYDPAPPLPLVLLPRQALNLKDLAVVACIIIILTLSLAYLDRAIVTQFSRKLYFT